MKSKGFFATLFGWEDPDTIGPHPPRRQRPRPAPRTTQVAAYAPRTGPFAGPCPRRSEPAARRTFVGPRRRPAGARAAEAAAAPGPPVPMPPRRPTERSRRRWLSRPPPLPFCPLPPARPAEFDRGAVASIVPATAPLPPAREARSTGAEVASLFGGAPGGKVLGTPGLPAVITEGARPSPPASCPTRPIRRPVAPFPRRVPRLSQRNLWACGRRATARPSPHPRASRPLEFPRPDVARKHGDRCARERPRRDHRRPAPCWPQGSPRSVVRRAACQHRRERAQPKAVIRMTSRAFVVVS